MRQMPQQMLKYLSRTRRKKTKIKQPEPFLNDSPFSYLKAAERLRQTHIQCNLFVPCDMASKFCNSPTLRSQDCYLTVLYDTGYRTVLYFVICVTATVRYRTSVRYVVSILIFILNGRACVLQVQSFNLVQYRSIVHEGNPKSQVILRDIPLLIKNISK